MQFRTLPRWVHNTLSSVMQRPEIRSSLNLCISEDRALILQLAHRPGRPARAVVAQYPVPSVQAAYDRLSTKQAPRFHSCYLIAATPSTLAAAQSAGVVYMRLPQRTSRTERRDGRALELLRVPMDVFSRHMEVQGV